MTATVNKSNLLPSPSPLEIMGEATLFREGGGGGGGRGGISYNNGNVVL